MTKRGGEGMKIVCDCGNVQELTYETLNCGEIKIDILGLHGGGISVECLKCGRILELGAFRG